MSKLLVVGKLGEVIKKVIELTDILKENKKVIELTDILKENQDQILMVELSAYQEVLNAWPIAIPKDRLDTLIQVFGYTLSSLKHVEQELLALTGSDQLWFMTVDTYRQRLTQARQMLAELNAVGMHIGPSPILEIEDEVEQPNLEHSVPQG